MAFSIYILQSAATQQFYKGITNNLKRRFKEHNNKEEQSTKSGVPWNLVWYTIKPTRSEALVLEKKLKNLTSHQRLIAFINKYPCVGGLDVPPLVEVSMKTKQ
jgi:putative endonuclease